MAEADYGLLGGTQNVAQVMQGQAAKGQALEAGALDAASKKNIYATQVMSAASSTMNQQLYDSAKAHLAQMGIDPSQWALDVQSGSQQAYAAKLSQSPYGALLNAASKMDSNQNAADIAAGKVPANPNALATGLLHGGMGPTLQDMTNPPNLSAPAAGPRTLPPPLPIQGQPGAQVGGLPLQVAPGANPANEQAIDANGSTPTKFVAPPRDPSQTQAANADAAAKALEQWKSNPAVVQATKAAEAAGADAGKLPLEAINSQEITNRLNQNIDKLLAINDKTPDSSMMDPNNKAYFSKRYGSGDDANYVDQWNQVDQQQILSDYGQLVKSGAIKGSRQIFQALQTGSGVPLDAPRAARAALLNNLRAEIANKNISTQNVNAAVNGGQKQDYQAIPTEEQIPIVANPSDAMKLPSGTQFKTPDGRVKVRP